MMTGDETEEEAVREAEKEKSEVVWDWQCEGGSWFWR